MSRKAFESEAIKHGFILDRLDKSGVYVQLITEQAWSIWQAATNAALERAAQVCDAAEIFAWEQWKGTGHPHTEGVSDGAASLARDIRALKETE